ncbi:MAG: alanine--tRNA ligase [Bacteroidales bacterium]|jgi:alanyl-tRNA synthetase|nr:alanine--tRNA ligase [Bacteroidales bacterium]
MDSKEIRTLFKEFFKENGHTIVSSDSMIIKGDPTLMFTNAGMNQFKDIFLGINKAKNLRVADSQKCLRVSGKHNDLEEVGHDTYHHTMFEMLGNWSFGDYFKEEAIKFAWILLTEKYKIDKNRLYVTVFGGDKGDNMPIDTEAEQIWSKYIDKSRILYGSKKDNFWEMGDVGPCGPCSEIHVDIRNDEERKKIDGKTLVNNDHPQVIEIWNLVFIQFNRKADASLEMLPQKHVDTGMGFERLCAVIQGKKSNYDTDVFQIIISKISEISGIKYGTSEKTDIALRVIADHLRAVSFAIADGQLPSNVKAGYVIRRILRRAIRYANSFLNLKEAFIYKLVDTLVKQMGDDYPELVSQQNLIEKVILEEENTFLKTLERGIKLLEQITENLQKNHKTDISGKDAFILYDTYGFPLDLTELIAKENNLTVNKTDFDVEMQKQKERGRNASEIETDDWIIINDCKSTEFVGYDKTEEKIKISKYRSIKQKNEKYFQLVFDKTPFYAESGGQVGDSGTISNQNDTIWIKNTIKEHNQVIHISENLPQEINVEFTAIVDVEKQKSSARNHSATHLLHFALRQILGTHVEQKGSSVDSLRLRFDFSHFNKVTDEEIRQIELLVNSLIINNISRIEHREMKIDEAKNLGAMSLFGEKYGDKVRMIEFGDSKELCGGIHVVNTGEIGFFKIISEGAVAAGIRRIEAITGKIAQDFVFQSLDELKIISAEFNNTKEIVPAVNKLITENSTLKKQLENYHAEELINIKNDIIRKAENKRETMLICENVKLSDSQDLKEICSQIRGQIDNFACVLGSIIEGKPFIIIAFSENLVNEKQFNAGKLIKEASKFIQGGGGGQANVATAGGKNVAGMQEALNFAKQEIMGDLFR